jgi:hypothetical protein
MPQSTSAKSVSSSKSARAKKPTGKAPPATGPPKAKSKASSDAPSQVSADIAEPAEPHYVDSDDDATSITSDVCSTVDHEKELGTCIYAFLGLADSLTSRTEAAKKTWRSPIYSFFKDNVTVEWLDNRPFHFFPCGARHCKTTLGGVRRYLDKGDKHSTANLMKHARRCFGEDAVKAAADGNTKDQNKSIFDAFARQGQEPVTFSHRSLTNLEAR